VVGVEQWAEIRRMQSWPGCRSRRWRGAPAAIANTVRRALRAKAAPRYERRPAPSKLDPFKEEIHRLLGEDAKLPGQRMAS
jgi:transposase